MEPREKDWGGAATYFCATRSIWARAGGGKEEPREKKKRFNGKIPEKSVRGEKVKGIVMSIRAQKKGHSRITAYLEKREVSIRNLGGL